MMNESAQDLLGMEANDKQYAPKNNLLTHNQLSEISQPLYELTSSWQDNEKSASQLIFKNTSHTPEVIVSIAQLNTEDKTATNDLIIFIEDHSRMTQHAQNLKLASLGQLTAAIAHEVRNPLGAISHAAQLLMESDTIHDADTRLAAIIQQHSLRVNQIIENVLGLSRRKPSNPQRFVIQDWLAKFIHENYEPSQIKISHHSSNPEATFDLSQLQQVMQNLFENGLRYSKINQVEYIQIIVGIENKSARPFIELIDFGPGISEEMHTRLFEPFFTTESTGTGLGLYISRELCQSNQARLDCIFNTQEHLDDKKQTDDKETPKKIGAIFRVTFAHPDKSLKQ